MGNNNKIALRPSYWASVSGGKDSLYMLNLILHNLDKYPLDGVVHFELEVDYPFVKNVVDYMEEECKKHGIRFERIKPRKTWEELYYSIAHGETGTDHALGFPTRKARWCNSKYKLDAKKQLDDFLKKQGFYLITYIGYCADEVKRFSKRNAGITEVCPLVNEGIYEYEIWQWAKDQPIFNNYYKTNKRCGCMYCPMSNKINFAYLYKYYPQNFEYMIDKMRETERERERELGRPFSVTSSDPKYNADYLENIIKTKWLKKLEDIENDVDSDQLEGQFTFM